MFLRRSGRYYPRLGRTAVSRSDKYSALHQSGMVRSAVCPLYFIAHDGKQLHRRSTHNNILAVVAAGLRARSRGPLCVTTVSPPNSASEFRSIARIIGMFRHRITSMAAILVYRTACWATSGRTRSKIYTFCVRRFLRAVPAVQTKAMLPTRDLLPIISTIFHLHY